MSVSSGTCARLLRQAKAEYASRNDLTRRGGSLLVVDNRALHELAACRQEKRTSGRMIADRRCVFGTRRLARRRVRGDRNAIGNLKHRVSSNKTHYKRAPL